MNKVPGAGEEAGSAVAVVDAAAASPGVATLPTWVLGAVAAFALALMWLVSFDNGQITGVLDSSGSYFHELFHDGRHLFGAPCH